MTYKSRVLIHKQYYIYVYIYTLVHITSRYIYINFILFFFTDNGISKRSLSPLALTTSRTESQTTGVSSIASALNNVTMVLQGASPNVGGSGGGSGCSTPTSGDYSRYVRRFSSCQECGSARCRDLNYRYGGDSFQSDSSGVH